MDNFKNPRANILINGEILNNVPEFKKKTLLPLLFKVTLKVLSSAIRQKK